MRDVSLVIFTDLDGTLLDRDTYSFDDAAEGLDAAGRAGVPVVLCSSKTRAEIEWIRCDLALRHPFISENGGALFVPEHYFPFPLPLGRHAGAYEVIEFGTPYSTLVDALHRVAKRLGVRVAGFHDMSVEDVARACGLSVTHAELAKRREYDEPFRVQDAAERAHVLNALRMEGLRCTRGSRFDHVTGGTDKGIAALRLRRMYEREPEKILITAGLGDSMNDLPLLAAVDIPIIVRNDQADAARLRRRLPAACVTDRPGPAGWGQAVARLVRALVSPQHGVVQ